MSKLAKEITFLLERLDEWSADYLPEGDGARDWCGHIDPSIARLRSLLTAGEEQG